LQDWLQAVMSLLCVPPKITLLALLWAGVLNQAQSVLLGLYNIQTQAVRTFSKRLSSSVYVRDLEKCP